MRDPSDLYKTNYLRMKNKRKLLRILIIGILFISTQIFFSACQSSSSRICVLHSSSQDTTRYFTKPDKSYEIVFYGLGDSIRQIAESSVNIIYVFVESKTSLGMLRYLPFYKPVSFRSNISYKWNIPESSNYTDSMVIQSGELYINGNYNLFGAYTKTDAEKLINELINNSIRTQIQKDIKSRLNVD